MMRLIKTIFLSFCLVMLFAQCKKSDPPKVPGGGGSSLDTPYYLASLKFSTGSDSFAFTRNSNKLVTRTDNYKYNYTNLIYELDNYTVYTYDGTKLAKEESYNSVGNLVEYYTYTYGTSDVTKKHFRNSVEDKRWVFKTAAYRLPTEVSYYEVDGVAQTTELIYRQVITMDSKKDNITKIEQYDITGKKEKAFVFTWDKKKSAFNTLPNFASLTGEDYILAKNRSKNNMLSYVEQDDAGVQKDGANIDYAYNKSNYPISYHDSKNNSAFYSYIK